MYAGKLVVLKIGGSVLKSDDDQFLAAQEIYRWYRDGYKVVVVVSALFGKTDQLFETANRFGADASPYTVAKLVSGAERESAALLGLTLDRCGIPNSVLLESEVQLGTCGNPLDATPVSLDVDFVKRVLESTPIVVMPGFVGRDENNRVNLLGRGGSDLTALFVANLLDADRCRLIKDVDGIYEFDPQKKGEKKPCRFETLSWSHALTLDKTILQHKAIKFAQKNQINFEVASYLGNVSTKIGCYKDNLIALQNEFEDKPLRIGLLGLGTVGQGVYEQLQRLDGFSVTKIAVRDLEKHRHATNEPELFTDNWCDVVKSDCDIVIELIGGCNEAFHAVTSALELGKQVVTANKSLLARHDVDIKNAQLTTGQQVFCSAAVGGATPMLESVEWLTNHYSIKRICGILNGTTNYVLDQCSTGVDWDDAVIQAQNLGLAETDPSGDLNGTDAAEKLVLLAQLAGINICFDEVYRNCQRIDGSDPVYRQIAELSQTEDVVAASVEIQPVEPFTLLADTCRQSNLLTIETTDRRVFTIRGSGAGRWPTSLAVVADLLTIRTRQLENKTQKREQAIRQPADHPGPALIPAVQTDD